MTDVSRSPGCMVNLGGFSINLGKTGMGTARKDDKQVNGAFYHVHWYKYPLTYWLNIITSAALDSRIYFDQNGVLSKRFGLTAVPTRITPAPSGERLNIETFPVK